MVLLILMGAEVYSHRLLNDGYFYVPALLGALLLIRISLPPPRPVVKVGKKAAVQEEEDDMDDDENDY